MAATESFPSRARPIRTMLAGACLTMFSWLAFAQAGASAPAAPAVKTEIATFAGGCFWCVESDFDKVPGVVSTTSGYTGGKLANPTYEQVSAGGTGHAESVQVRFDPSKVSYSKLLDVYWHSIDPLAVDSQFCDHGAQYRTAIFTHDATQQRLAEESKLALMQKYRFTQPIATQIVPATKFYPAEQYHQDYHLKNPVRYHFYRYRCGRDQRLEALWGKTK